MASPLNAARRHAGVPHDAKDYRSLPGTGMRRGVDLAELVDRDQGVDLGGRHRGVAEQLLDHPNVGAAVEEVGCEGMAENVRRYPGESGSFGGGLQHLPGALPGQPPAPGVEEHARGCRGRGRAGRAGLGRGRRRAPSGRSGRGGRPWLRPPLPRSRTCSCLQVVDGQADGFGDAGAGAVQDLQQGAVAEGERRAVGAGGGDEPLDLVDGDRPWGAGGAGAAVVPAWAGSCGVTPSRSAKRCRPRTAETARAAELATRAGCSPSPSRSAARKAAHVGLAHLAEA